VGVGDGLGEGLGEGPGVGTMITPSPGEATSSAPQAASGIKVLIRRSVRTVDMKIPLKVKAWLARIACDESG
jgi:hypothetical protein